MMVNDHNGMVLMVTVYIATNLKITFPTTVSGASSHPSRIPGAIILLNDPLDTTFPL
jgi:hypothetical protein